MRRSYKFLPLAALALLSLVTACKGTGPSQAPGGFPACNPGCNGSHAEFVVVGDVGAQALLTYDTGTASTPTTGNLTPKYNNHSSTLNYPFFIFNDYESNLWAANYDGTSVTWYAVTATGASPTAHTVSGSNTTLGCPTGVYVDANGNMYVSDPCSTKGYPTIDLFASSGSPASPPSGNVAPSAWIGGGSTTLSDPQGLTIDSGGHVWAIDAATASIDEFAKPGVGSGQNNYAPAGALTSTALVTPLELYIDSQNHLWVGDEGSGNGEVLEFPLATGSQTSLCTISGSNTGFAGGQVSVAVDNAGYVYAVTNGAAQIAIFSHGQCGNVVPTYTISGASTGLSHPSAIVVYSTGND